MSEQKNESTVLDPQLMADLQAKPCLVLVVEDNGDVSPRVNMRGLDLISLLGYLEITKNKLLLQHLRVLAMREAEKQREAESVALTLPRKDIVIPR